ncbi:MAG: type II toxin-antitoxin system PemK/MazF family toxin [Neisseriales bacterium]|nr:MAG: type II toxin-antitoxin system PemK/MazF family toxin [Neisseriales bacterium]
MNRGDVYWVNFDPAVDSEIQKKRPAVIVSNNLNNMYMQRVQVLPVTSNVSRVYPCEALVQIRGKQGKALADQITTVDKNRFGDFIGSLNSTELENITKVIKIQLDL